MVIHGNHPETLRDLVLAWTGRHPLAPLEDEQVLVQSNGVAQWLKLAFARDARDGGCGIAAGLRMELPSRFVWRTYRAVLGEDAVPDASPFDKAALVWRLMRLLPALLREDVFEPLRRFLQRDDDLRKRHQLAERLADLFDQYQVYRADWLEAWARGEDVVATSRQGVQPVAPAWLWQPRLWRAVRESVDARAAAGGRAEVHGRFLDAARAWRGPRPPALPERVIVFGISSLPQQSLEVLAAAARWCQVLMCVHNPCEHDWSHVVADKDLLRAERLRQRRRPGGEGAIAEEALHLHAQPLLAAWGRQGRDFIRLLDGHDERERYEPLFAGIGQRVDAFFANGGATLLEQLQDDIRDLRPPAETRARWPAVDPRRDGSIRFHVAHGAQREVEILHDRLLAAFAADPGLRPRDVLVMVPDIAAYAPHVQAVFGLFDAEDARHIPFAVADRGARRHDPLLGAVERLLRLPESRFAVTEVLDLLDAPAVRARFGIGEDQLPLLRRWIEAAGIRWGLHAGQRGALGLPDDLSANTWRAGLRRMLLGYAAGGGDAWGELVPMDEVGGLDAALLGPLVRFVDALEAHWEALRRPAAPAAWGERLRALLADFLAVETDADVATLARLEEALQAWLDACADAGLVEALPLSVPREHWLAQMDPDRLDGAFLTGGVTFATLMPMRAIPFRWVALLGMNGDDYPRRRPAMDFDLMAQDYRPGDRSRREDDRYLFLEALLSARRHLHVSWVGRSIVDNGERPPSVLVAQLRDHLAAGWRLAGATGEGDGRALLDALTLEHPLQPFSPAYFTASGDPRLFSYAREWRAAAGAAAPPALPEPPLAPLAHPPAPSLQGLAEFLRDPAASFFERRLGVHLDEADPPDVDHEPFELGKLDNWRLQDELIVAQRAALEAGGAREEALAARLDAMALRGDLPVGAFGAAVQRELAEPMAGLFDRYAQTRADWPGRLPDEPVRFEALVDGFAVNLDDWLGDLHRGAGDARARVLLASTGLVDAKTRKYRRDKLLRHWVPHLAGHLGGRPLTTVLVSKVGTVTLPPLDAAQARMHWDALIAAWCEGLRRPLPLAVATGFAWLAKGGRAGAASSEALDAARKSYEGEGGERERHPCLARAFPDFDALAADGAFARLADALLRPLAESLADPARAGKAGAEAGA
jgi:exodeoxyribonuclease V gamma subunit